jgi:transglutaminase-like putative cysteine protease
MRERRGRKIPGKFSHEAKRGSRLVADGRGAARFCAVQRKRLVLKRVGLHVDCAASQMNEFLQSTAVIDSDHPAIVAMAEEVGGPTTDDEQIARRCFFWVRDSVGHSVDTGNPVVTCVASDVLKHRAGFCYAKSHLLAALLRARAIPAALCYQRLSLDAAGTAFFLHGLVAVHLKRHGWYRVDPRGDKPGVTSDFCPPVERLPYAPKLPGERDVPGRLADPLSCVVATLRRWPTAGAVRANLPDDPTASPQKTLQTSR